MTIIQDRMNIKNTFCTKFYYEFELHNNTYAVQFYIFTCSTFEKASITNLRVYIYIRIFANCTI